MSTRRRVITEPDGTKDTAGTLDGKRALVTGGTRGMGAAIARLLAGRNARVLVTARHPAADCAARLIQADLAAPEGADLVAGEAIRVLGGLDIVAHCVGSPFAKPGGALALTDEDWMDALNTNLLAAVRLDRAVLPAMIRQRSGVIVHVSSLQWKRPHESSPAYGPAKAALRSYSKVLATEVGPPSSSPSSSPTPRLTSPEPNSSSTAATTELSEPRRMPGRAGGAPRCRSERRGPLTDAHYADNAALLGGRQAHRRRGVHCP